MKGRTIVRTREAAFRPYDLDGPLQEDMSYLALSYDARSRQGAYLIRMQPGARTIAHAHRRREEYLILEGDLVEDDGTVLGPGDYVIMAPGTRHDSRTEHGCLLFGIDWDRDPPDTAG